MSAKLLLYLFVLIIVVFSIEGLNINFIFKKNRTTQAIIFYILLSFSLTYLVTNFIYDTFTYFN